MPLEVVLCRPSATPLFERPPSPPRIHVTRINPLNHCSEVFEIVATGNKAYVAAARSPVTVRRSLKTGSRRINLQDFDEPGRTEQSVFGGRTLKPSERNLDA